MKSEIIPVAGIRGQGGLNLAEGGRHRKISGQDSTRESEVLKKIFGLQVYRKCSLKSLFHYILIACNNIYCIGVRLYNQTD